MCDEFKWNCVCSCSHKFQFIFSLVLVLLEHIIDSSLEWSPLHPQKWYSKSTQDERWRFCFFWHFLSAWILTWKDFLSLQHHVGRARSNSFSTSKLCVPKDEDKLMSVVLSVKVSHYFSTLTTTTDTRGKYLQGTKIQMSVSEGHQVCNEGLVLCNDPATGKASALGAHCLC